MFEAYRDDKSEWRWRLVASNGRIIADSGESYTKRSALLKAIERVKTVAAGAGTIERLS